MTCSCNTSMDIRGRCCPVYHKKDFALCPARVDTAFIHFENSYEVYKLLEKTNYDDYETITKTFLKSMGIRFGDFELHQFYDMLQQKFEDDNGITELKDTIKELEGELKDAPLAFGWRLECDKYPEELEQFSLVWKNIPDSFSQKLVRVHKQLLDHFYKEDYLNSLYAREGMETGLNMLYKELKQKYEPYFNGTRYFNRFIFRVGTIITRETGLTGSNSPEYNEIILGYYTITKTTKTHIKAYPMNSIIYDTFGNVSKYTKPKEFYSVAPFGVRKNKL